MWVFFFFLQIFSGSDLGVEERGKGKILRRILCFMVLHFQGEKRMDYFFWEGGWWRCYRMEGVKWRWQVKHEEKNLCLLLGTEWER